MYFCTFWYIIQKCRVPMIPCPCRCHARTKLPPMCHVPLPLPWPCPDQAIAVLCTAPSQARLSMPGNNTRGLRLPLRCDTSGNNGRCIVSRLPPTEYFLWLCQVGEFAWILINSFTHQIITIKKLRKE
jgi:hypothetical protein